MANEYEIQTLKEQSSEKDIYPNIISDCIPEDAVETSHIKNNAITTAKIADGAVTIGKISGTFGGDRIDNNSISTAKIQNKAVTTTKIDDGAVTVGKIADGAVVEEKIDSDAITTSKIKNGAVTTAKIADGAVTLDKISSITQGSTVATTEYVDEHGGGGGSSTLYKHFIHLTFLDGCSPDYDINGWVILENTLNTQFDATTFKALFDSPNLFEDNDAKIMTTLSNQCIKVGWSTLESCCYNYSPISDYFNCEANYSGELTLATITDTVTSV